MSHAFVEVRDATVAGAVLRGEAQANSDIESRWGTKPGKRRERGSVLGKGRRARGVTVTRSGQEELMTDVCSPISSHPSRHAHYHSTVVPYLAGDL